MAVITVFIKSCRECPAMIYNHDREMGFCVAMKKIIYDVDKIHCKGLEVIPKPTELLPKIKDLP